MAAAGGGAGPWPASAAVAVVTVVAVLVVVGGGEEIFDVDADVSRHVDAVIPGFLDIPALTSMVDSF